MNPRENHLGEYRDAHRPWPFRLKDSGWFCLTHGRHPGFLGPQSRDQRPVVTSGFSQLAIPLSSVAAPLREKEREKDGTQLLVCDAQGTYRFQVDKESRE